MKRVLAVLLTVCTLLTMVGIQPVAAKPVDADPYVFLLGYSTADIYYFDGESDAGQRVWNLTAKGVAELAVKNLPQALWGLFKALVFKKYDTLNDAAAKIAEPVLQKMERLTMLPDGSAKYDTSVYPYGHDIPLSFYKNTRGVYLNDPYRTLMNAYGRVYVFVADWRYSQTELAEQLDAFIQDVKADSGKDQVSLFGFSQGGQTISTYLYYYGDKHDVKKAVMETPAIAGTSFTTAILDDSKFSVPVDVLIQFAESYSELESHYEWLGKLVGIDFLKKAILSIVAEHVFPIGLYWGSLWDLVPAKDYDRLKEKYLDPEACAKLIERSDAYHYDVIPNIGAKLRALRAEGVDISIVCNPGQSILFTKVDGDGILETANVSGAMVASYGSHFNEDCKPQGTVCKNENHNHISPSLALDASTCYLPENTWFVEGQFHGQSDWDTYNQALFKKLLLTDDLKDVYSDPAFPQFVFGQSPADEINISFADTGSYVGGNSVTITNLYTKKSIQLQGVTIKNSRQKVEGARGVTLAPGESVTLAVKGNAKVGVHYSPVTVYYTLAGDKVPVLHSKTFATSSRRFS